MSEREEDAGPDLGPRPEPQEPKMRVYDRRHWAQPDSLPTDDNADEGSQNEPSALREWRQRAEDAERKLLECVSAFRQSQVEQEQFRERMTRDVDRRVQFGFGNLVADLVECVDDMELALTHASATPGAEALAHGVALARNRFLSALEKAGVERVDPIGAPFDPNDSEAIRLAAVDSSDQDGTVVETLRPGYRLGERVIRPAQVAVGRHGVS